MTPGSTGPFPASRTASCATETRSASCGTPRRTTRPGWKRSARPGSVIHFENFIVADDGTGQAFAEALIERAAAGVTVRVLYDWLGSSSRALPGFWNRLRRAGIEVRVFNPPRLTAPSGSAAIIGSSSRSTTGSDSFRACASPTTGGARTPRSPGATRAWRSRDRSSPTSTMPSPRAGRSPGSRCRPMSCPDPQAIPRGRHRAGPRDLRPARHVPHLPARPVHRRHGPEDPLDHRRLFRRHHLLRAGARGGRAGRGRRAASRAGLERRAGAAADRPGRLPLADRERHPGLRVERLHAPRQDGGGGRAMVAGRLDQSQPRELGHQLGARRRRGGRRFRGRPWKPCTSRISPARRRSFRAAPRRRRQAANLRPRRGRLRAHKRAFGRLAAGAIALGNTVGTAVGGSRSLTATEAKSVAVIGAVLVALAGARGGFPGARHRAARHHARVVRPRAPRPGPEALPPRSPRPTATGAGPRPAEWLPPD